MLLQHQSVTVASYSTDSYTTDLSSEFRLKTLENDHLFQTVIDRFPDGILIVTQQGEWIFANGLAEQTCTQFRQISAQSCQVPQKIWQICRTLINGHHPFVDQLIALDAETLTEGAIEIRIRVQWLQWEDQESYLLIILENWTQAIQNLAMTEAKKFNLTSREADVWFLRRTGYSYEAIANHLYITTNTVKKHLKNVYAKREMEGTEYWDEA